jgi:hypothetical protein
MKTHGKKLVFLLSQGFTVQCQCSNYDKHASNMLHGINNIKIKLGWGISNIPGNICAKAHNHTHTALTVAVAGAARLQC